MMITMKEDGSRFGVRVGCIIYNHDKTAILLQKQGKHDYYMFPGGRLEVHEDSETAIKRELIEELGIKEEVKLKYILESFIQFPNLKYHEIGFYFITTIEENKYNYEVDKEYKSLDEENDGESIFRWIKITELDNYKITPDVLKDKLYDINDCLEHLVYREY